LKLLADFVADVAVVGMQLKIAQRFNAGKNVRKMK
jgi:hypothetical protein